MARALAPQSIKAHYKHTAKPHLDETAETMTPWSHSSQLSTTSSLINLIWSR